MKSTLRFAPSFRRALPLVLALLSVVAVAQAESDEAGQREQHCGARPWVRLRFDDDTWPPEFQKRVLDDLRAGLATRDIDVCWLAREASEGATPSTGQSASAEVVLKTAGPGKLSVTVRDALTRKAVQRDVDLTQVPEDSRAFAAALATDELVWASWAEIALEPSRDKPTTAPAEVVRAVEKDLGRRRLPTPSLGARAVLNHYATSYTQYGAEAVVLVPLSNDFLLEGALGYVRGEVLEAPRGEVASQGATLGLAARYVVFRSGPARFDLGLGAQAALLEFEGRAAPNATESRFAALLLDGRARSTLTVELAGPLAAELAAGAGYTAKGAEPTDSGEPIVSASGLQWSGALGVLFSL